MAARQVHNPHVMRPHLNEWCGGTEPPTILTSVSKDEIRVDIFEKDTDIHNGYIRERLVCDMFWTEIKLTQENAGIFALRALEGRRDK